MASQKLTHLQQVPSVKYDRAWTMTCIRANAWLAVLVIVILSLVPGNQRPNVLGNGYVEHFTAYFITACLLTIGYSRPMQLLANWGTLATFAGVLEVVQFAIPGRTPRIADFAMGIIGAGIGVVVTSLIRRMHRATTVRANR